GGEHKTATNGLDLHADADRVRLSRNTQVADVDIIVCCGETPGGAQAPRSVIVASCIARERSPSKGRVEIAGCVALERGHTGGRVAEALCVEMHRLIPGRGVTMSSCIVMKHRTSCCDVHNAGRVV